MARWQYSCSTSCPLGDQKDRVTSSSLKAKITNVFESLPKISLFKVSCLKITTQMFGLSALKCYAFIKNVQNVMLNPHKYHCCNRNINGTNKSQIGNK